MSWYQSDAAKVLYFEKYLTHSSIINLSPGISYISITKFESIREEFIIFFGDDLKSFSFESLKWWSNSDPIEYHLKLLTIIKQSNIIHSSNITFTIIIQCVAKILKTRVCDKKIIDETLLWKMVDELLNKWNQKNIYGQIPRKDAVYMVMMLDLEFKDIDNSLRQQCCGRILNAIISHYIEKNDKLGELCYYNIYCEIKNR